MLSAELRISFLAYFKERGHHVVSSASLVPTDDPTLLFTNAGMNQFKDVFLGREQRDYVRAVSSQKCMRVSGKHNDLENVGPSLRHQTFFEMLGNFSFGDYFKKDAIKFAWELLTEEWKLPKERLVATVFNGEAGIPRDDEAYREWERYLPIDRICELGLDENFWSMGNIGPCGRCSEVHYFRGEHLPCAQSPCLGISCNCDRYIEIWNNVFMEFNRGQDQALSPLPAPSIDTGMGLDRITAVIQDVPSNYDTDLFRPLLKAISDISSVPYSSISENNPDKISDISMRVIADHIRATTFLIADGVMPSNEWRGYVLRKIMRRAIRHGKRLGTTSPFLHHLVDVVVENMGDAYLELSRNRDSIVEVVKSEETRFDAVLADGLPRLEKVLSAASTERRAIRGDEAFRLYDTFGLPLDYLEDIAGEHSLTIDRVGFEAALDDQRKRARSKQNFGKTMPKAFQITSQKTQQTLNKLNDQFEGYNSIQTTGTTILTLFDEQRQQKSELKSGTSGYVVLERTPFYVESGGQVSDEGLLSSEQGNGNALVTSMTRLYAGGPRVHAIKIDEGSFREQELVTAKIDNSRRNATKLNHTATHLLHAGLRQVLGKHVKQAGSLVAPDRLRFDFVHFAPVTQEQLNLIEHIVNKHIRSDSSVLTKICPTQEAIASGATALFGEKYGDTVRVVSISDFSTELCGGTHCQATGEIGTFLVLQESGVAAGIRRIEASTGKTSVDYVQQRRNTLQQILCALETSEPYAAKTVTRLQSDLKTLSREVGTLKVKAAMGSFEGDPKKNEKEIIEVNGVKLMAKKVSGLEKSSLRELADSLNNQLKSGIVVLASATNNKVLLIVSVTDDLLDRIKAGNIVKALAPIVGGTGGGKARFAEAGGRQINKIDDLIASSRDVIAKLLTSDK
jgi:alanyl-tRNA synthetase